jgi:hypothetical protein
MRDVTPLTPLHQLLLSLSCERTTMFQTSYYDKLQRTT